MVLASCPLGSELNPSLAAGGASSSSPATVASGSSVKVSAVGDSESPPVNVSPPTRSYASVANPGIGLTRMGNPTKHVSGIPFILIPDENVATVKEEFKDYIFAQFHGPPPDMGRIIGVVNALWARSGPRIFVHRIGPGTFLLRVTNPRTRSILLSRNLCNIAGHPMFVAPWSPDFTPEKPPLTKAQVTVEFRGIPYLLFNDESLARIVSGVGEPKALHPETARRETFEVAKILIEVNLLEELPSKLISGFSDGREFQIDVKYPWLPPKCSSCSEFGHSATHCPKAPAPSEAKRDHPRSKSRGSRSRKRGGRRSSRQGRQLARSKSPDVAPQASRSPASIASQVSVPITSPVVADEGKQQSVPGQAFAVEPGDVLGGKEPFFLVRCKNSSRKAAST